MSSVLHMHNAGAAAKNKQAVLCKVTQLAKLKYYLQRPLVLVDVM